MNDRNFNEMMPELHANGEPAAILGREVSWIRFWAYFWKRAEQISEDQGKVLVNWHQWFPAIALAPLNNYQDILPGWFSINMESSDPALERYIVTDVASYGSQLGTISDCLEVVLKRLHLNDRELSREEAKAIDKFNQVTLKIQKAKEAVGRKSFPRISDKPKATKTRRSKQLAKSESR